MAQSSTMRRRCSPAHLPAEVALVMLLVALAAQWCHLVRTPNFGGTSLLGETEVAEAAGDQATIDTRPYQHVCVTRREPFDDDSIVFHGTHLSGRWRCGAESTEPERATTNIDG